MIFTQELKKEIFAPGGKRTIVSDAIIVERSTKKSNLPASLKPTPVGDSRQEQKSKPE
jgi:hypothetical protein